MLTNNLAGSEVAKVEAGVVHDEVCGFKVEIETNSRISYFLSEIVSFDMDKL